MANSQEPRPLAAQEYEDLAHEIFPVATMAPEEYVARFGADWACCSFPTYSYRDEVLDAWLQKFNELMMTQGMLEKLREQYLTPEELEKARELDEEDCF